MIQLSPRSRWCFCNPAVTLYPGAGATRICSSKRGRKSTHKSSRRKHNLTTRLRPESPTELPPQWQACKYKVHKLHQRYILRNKRTFENVRQKRFSCCLFSVLRLPYSIQLQQFQDFWSALVYLLFCNFRNPPNSERD